jgi:hypothetical protein
MSGHGDPPEGTPEGVPGGGDDEYRSVVFDESFVRAARIQEFSAEERQDDAARAVRIRHVLPRGLARQAVAMIMLIVVAFGFAIYMGVRHPYKAHGPIDSQQLRATVIPLVPTRPVPEVAAGSPFAGTGAAGYKAGADGIDVPEAHRIGGFAPDEVEAALSTAKEYLADSSLDKQTVLHGYVGAVHDLLDPGQVDQFDASLVRPADDGSHEATGWLVRFDPAAAITLAPGGVRVRGTLNPSQTSDHKLEIASDHTFVYAVRGTGAADTGVSLFTVRRQMLFRFDHEDLRQHHVQVIQATVDAGPLACNGDVDEYFRPMLAGSRAAPLTGANPYQHGQPAGSVCAPLANVVPTAATPTAVPSAAATPSAATPTATASAGTVLSPAGGGPGYEPGYTKGAGGTSADAQTAFATPQLPARAPQALQNLAGPSATRPPTRLL